MSRHPGKFIIRTLPVLALLAVTAAACGDDDSDGDAASGDTERFCSAVIETYTTFNRTFAGIDFETTSEEEFGQILTDLQQEVEPLFDQIEANTPEALSEVVDVRLRVARQALETGEEDDSPEAREAERVLDEFALTECDVQSFDVVMTEHSFSGLPEQVNAGVAAFDLRNEGAQHHDFGIYRVTTQTSETPAELVDGDHSELERVGGTDLPSGDAVATFVELSAGRYLVADLFPVEGAGEDETHASRGMVTELIVE